MLPPYIDLGFDQRMIAENQASVAITMGELQTSPSMDGRCM
jgi:hypothetical protein